MARRTGAELRAMRDRRAAGLEALLTASLTALASDVDDDESD